MSAPLLIWFQLFDAATEDPYKGTGADKVAVSSTADVADFRKAVKAEYSNKLSSVDAGELLVYKNKTSFEKRNASFDDGKEEPLEEDSLLDGLGRSKKEALIVIVPSYAENSSGMFTAPDIVLAIRDLTFEIRDNNKFLKKATKDKFTLLKPKSYKSDNHDIRLQWLIHYGMVSSTSNELPKVAHCHLLGAKVPMMYLNCSHLFQKRWHRHVRDFGLPSINSGKNILILLKIFEEAFDAGRFVLLFDKQTGLIRCKIIDNELKNKNLNEAMKDVFPNYTIGAVDFNGKTCFGDFDGEELHFLNAERPYTRCLSFHALVAREHAIDYGWIGETDLKELDDDDMWSDGFLDEKTRKFIDEWRVDVCSQLS
jgi:hypothetical protein